MGAAYPSVLSATAFARGLGFHGWRGTHHERALKSGVLQHDRFLILASNEFVDSRLLRHDTAHDLNGAFFPRFTSAFDTSEIDWTSLYRYVLGEALRAYVSGEDGTHVAIDARHEHLIASLLQAQHKRGDSWHQYLEESLDFWALSFVSLPLAWQIKGTPFCFSTDLGDIGWVVQPSEKDAATPRTVGLADALIPDWSRTTWKTLSQMVTTGAAEDLVGVFARLGSFTNESLAAQLSAELWRFAKGKAPTITSAVIRNVASNIPVPIANPLGVWFSISEIKESVEFRGKYPVLFSALELDRLTPPSLDEDAPVVSLDESALPGALFESNAAKDPGAIVVELLDSRDLEAICQRRRKCRGLTPSGPCQREAGWGTQHPGFGLCAEHFRFNVARRP